ncbi:MAG TPA: HpcH/HpaI aldolase/citrate lyase family protein [Candidatus Microsaccharimonas sp.]|jgi:citrate lyase beta subunit
MSTSTLHPTLYAPAIMEADKLIKLVNHDDGSNGIWRIVLCTEDSIREEDIPEALNTIRTVLAAKRRNSGVAVYVRVRNHEVMAQVLALPNADKLEGFVIPKADPVSFPLYAEQVSGLHFRLMPILESHLMFMDSFRATLREVLKQYRDQIECLRIGANDLMGHLGIRRDDEMFTIYDTPVGNLIYQIINEFRGVDGFTITAPVFECFDEKYDQLLLREVRQHMMNGLYGQTVIHTRHMRIIRDAYRVSNGDLQSAQGIVQTDTAVLGLNGKMDERATHLNWAELMIERHNNFGETFVEVAHVPIVV